MKFEFKYINNYILQAEKNIFVLLKIYKLEVKLINSYELLS